MFHHCFVSDYHVYLGRIVSWIVYEINYHFRIDYSF